MHLGDFASGKNKLEIWGKATWVRPPPYVRLVEIRGEAKFSRHQSHVAWTQMHWHTPNAHCRLRV